MPLFDFACDRCGSRFEELVSSASSEVFCETCGEPARKLPSAFAVSRGRGSAASRAPMPVPSGGG